MFLCSLMRPKKTETAVHGCLIPAGEIWLCACVRCWCNVCPPCLKLSFDSYTYFRQFDCEKLTVNLYLLAKGLKWSSPHFIKRKEALLVTKPSALLPRTQFMQYHFKPHFFLIFFIWAQIQCCLENKKMSGNSSLRDNSLAKTFAGKSQRQGDLKIQLC